MRALVTGATGFIGRRLLARLERPVVLTRDAVRAKSELADRPIDAFAWDSMSGPPPAAAFDGVDTVFHLAGEPIASGRWTDAKKQRIRDSRVVGTQNLVRGLLELKQPPRVLVSGSAVGYYGSRGDEILDETATPGHDYLAQVCRDWEVAALAARAGGIRAVCSRTGVVLGKGGALQKMLLPFKLGLGGRLGDGKQWMSWIHVDDLVSMMLHATTHDDLVGPMNGVGPNPVTNSEFTKTLANSLHRPAILPAPYFGLRLAFGEFAEVLFQSQRCVPRAVERTGFSFQYPNLANALQAILG